MIATALPRHRGCPYCGAGPETAYIQRFNNGTLVEYRFTCGSCKRASVRYSP